MVDQVSDSDQDEVVEASVEGAEAVETDEAAKDSVDELSRLISEAQDAQSEDAPAESEETSGESDEDQAEAEGKTAESEGDEETDGSESDEGEQAVEEEAEAQAAPEDWPAPQREAFAKLPKEAQDVLLEQSKALTSGYHRKSQDLAETSRFADSVREVIAPYEQQMAIAGLDAPRAIGQLFALHRTYTEDPVGYLRMVAADVAQRTGVDLATLATQGDQQDIDPGMAHIQGELQQIKQAIVTRDQQAQQSAYNQNQAVVDAFKVETSETGDLKHPHFEAVESLIPYMIPAIKDANPGFGPREILEAAYDQAVWASPDLRTKLLEAEKANAVKTTVTKISKSEKESVEKAKKAKTAVKSGGGSTKQVVSGDLDKIVGSAVDQFMG